MSRTTVLIRQYIASRPSRRDISSTSPKRTSTSPQRWNAAAPAVSAALKPFSDIPGPVSLPILRYSYHVLPRVGSYHHTVGLGVLEGLHNKYGDLVRLAKGRSRPVLYVFDPEMMREVYESGVTEPPVWERSPLRQHRAHVGDRCPHHSQESRAIWAAIRALLQDGTLLRNYEQAFEDIAADATRRLGELRHAGNALNEELETEVYRWATETIGILVFGIRLGCLDGKAYIPSTENRTPETDNHRKGKCSLYNRSVDKLTFAERLIKCSREIADGNYLVRSEETLKTESHTFNEALKALDRHFSLTEHFLQRAMQALASTELRPEQSLLDKLRPLDTRILPLAADVLLAGVQPLAQTAISMLYQLSLHAAQQQRAHDEVRWAAESEAAGAGSQRLQYVAACAGEALRMQPATGGVLRWSWDRMALAGHEIPAGVDIVLAHGVTSKSEKQWGRAKSFIPERWCAEGWQPLKASRAHPCASMPFGELCPATGVVTSMLGALAARILDTYRLEWHGSVPQVTTTGVNRLQPPYNFVLQKAA